MTEQEKEQRKKALKQKQIEVGREILKVNHLKARLDNGEKEFEDEEIFLLRKYKYLVKAQSAAIGMEVDKSYRLVIVDQKSNHVKFEEAVPDLKSAMTSRAGSVAVDDEDDAVEDDSPPAKAAKTETKPKPVKKESPKPKQKKAEKAPTTAEKIKQYVAQFGEGASAIIKDYGKKNKGEEATLGKLERLYGKLKDVVSSDSDAPDSPLMLPERK